MTTHEQTLNSVPMSAQGDQDLVFKTINSIQDHVDVSKQGWTLRRRLLMTVVPLTLIPLVVASVIGIYITKHRVEKEELTKLEQTAVSSREITYIFLQDALNIVDRLEANQLVIQTLESSTKQVQSQGLLNKPIEQVEQEFKSTKLLAPNPALNSYLQDLAQTQGIVELIITDENGFNVAYSSPTSNFVQSHEQWWQIGHQERKKVLESNFDDSTKTVVIETVSPLKNPNTGKVFGVAKVSVSTTELNKLLLAALGLKFSGSEVLQIIDEQQGKILNTLTEQGSVTSAGIIGGESVAGVIKNWTQSVLAGNPENAVSRLQRINGISKLELQQSEKKADLKVLTFESQGRYFKITPIPDTNFLAVVSVEKAEIAKPGNELMTAFASIAIFLGLLVIGNIILLAQNLSQPLINLADKAQQVTIGDLEVQAEIEGTEETRTLAENFNNLVKRVKGLIREQEAVTGEQRQQKETLEREIHQLLNELQDAVEGDLTVRASLTSMEMSTVADLFNAIIDSLKDIAVQVKESSTQVSSSLGKNEKSIQLLAEQAIQEAEETRKTLGSIEQMSHSIEEVTANANQAAILADDAYQETKEGTNAMDETVNSILSLRMTVGETAKKMKRLGESSQKISQVVSLIEEIALKTNLLAINASVEASRAGEQGQGFTVVAEQVGALAEQSSAATKEIAKIVAAIQAETQEVTQAMEVGTAQVVDTTRLVESTKQRLEQVLERSNTINELMQLISQSTASQTETSRTVTDLMQQIAQQSEERLNSSQQIAQSMQATAQVAKQLESAVEQFKVNK